MAAIWLLVSVDDDLALAAIELAVQTALAADCDPALGDDDDDLPVGLSAECLRMRREIRKAQAAYAEGLNELAAGEYDRAISWFKKAWEHAREVASCVPPGGDDDDDAVEPPPPPLE